MYVRRTVTLWMLLNWSKWPFLIGAFYGGCIYAFASLLGLDLSLPWPPLSVIGVGAALYLGFKNNSSYDRIWEARKIWGSIVNNSRTFGAAVLAFVDDSDGEAVQRELIYRHIAWMTALRHQLRLSREWERVDQRQKGPYAPKVSEDYFQKLHLELASYLPPTEVEHLKGTSNEATQILRMQSVRLQELRNQGYFEDFRHMELHQLLRSFYEDQGKSERIKNFPLPRQYASIGKWITLVFCGLVPFGLLGVTEAPSLLWLCSPVSGLVIWVFMVMEKVGESSENPFEGTHNDVPITAIARTIEIDLREMLEETSNVPKPIKADECGFLM